MRVRLLPKICRILFTVALLAGCGSSSQSGNPYSAAIAEGRAAVNDAIKETGARAISVALVDGDKVIWSEAFGAATTDTLYDICSVSKMLRTSTNWLREREAGPRCFPAVAPSTCCCSAQRGRASA